MRNHASRAILVVLALAGAPVLAGIEPVSDGLRRCALEPDAQKRLTCFDALVSGLPKTQSDQFGMTVDIARRRDPMAVTRSQNESLTGKISALQEAPHGETIFTLDSGQIWIQAESRSSIRFEVGEAVQIEHGAMGSLWLAADHHRKTRVKRIQ